MSEAYKKVDDRLAILGGPPCITEPPPAWPYYDDKDRQALTKVLESRVWGGYNEAIKELEQRYAEFHGATYGIATANGTVSLEIALRAAGIRPGDEVIVPPITFIASATAILSVGAVPVFVDIDPATVNLDPNRILAALTDKTRGIVLVHFAGCPADLDSFSRICRDHNLILIEDCAHAHGAEWRNQRVGSFGHFGSFSFQASKNMTAGEGGMLITNDAELAERARSITNQGRRTGGEWYEHVTLGTNARLSGFQACLLLNQLERLPQQIASRMNAASQLRAVLKEIDGLTPTPETLSERVTVHSYHLFPMKFDQAGFGGVRRERVIDAIQAEGVPVSPGYPIPIYQQEVFQHHKYRGGQCDEAEEYCRSAMWLPHNLLLGDEDFVENVLAAVKKVRRASRQLI
ncbi:MAG TPA: DegT/DnrJ/EryC1/StrS family aminotransferase [Pyrinomonadaceae bacterium]|nr:DegT/DnrJ/EryC1/StrS family aminotransferase [Pyrinomonadaceae bacterium]